MNVASILEIFRMVAAEFGDISDEVVTSWIYLTAPLVSRRHFRQFHEQALALLTAHRMKMADVGGTPGAPDLVDDVGGMGNFTKIASYTEGKVSVKFNHDKGQYDGLMSELELTEYGIQYMSLMRMGRPPITSAGQKLRRF